MRLFESSVPQTTRPPRWFPRLFHALALAAALVAVPSFADAPAANPQRYLNDVKVLAAPDMEGRGAGT